MGFHPLLQEIFPAGGLNPGLHRRCSLLVRQCIIIWQDSSSECTLYKIRQGFQWCWFFQGQFLCQNSAERLNHFSFTNMWERVERLARNVMLVYISQGNMGVRVLVTQLCLTLCHSMYSSPPGSSVHGILQARILEWVASSFSKETWGVGHKCLYQKPKKSLKHDHSWLVERSLWRAQSEQAIVKAGIQGNVEIVTEISDTVDYHDSIFADFMKIWSTCKIVVIHPYLLFLY